MVAALIAVLGAVLSIPLLRLLKTPQNIINDAANYLRIYSLGMPFMFLYNVQASVFSALGNSKTPFHLLVMSFEAVTNQSGRYNSSVGLDILNQSGSVTVPPIQTVSLIMNFSKKKGAVKKSATKPVDSSIWKPRAVTTKKNYLILKKGIANTPAEIQRFLPIIKVCFGITVSFIAAYFYVLCILFLVSQYNL